MIASVYIPTLMFQLPTLGIASIFVFILILSILMVVYLYLLLGLICIKLMMMIFGIFSYVYWPLEYSLLGSACSYLLLIFFLKNEFSVLFLLICKIFLYILNMSTFLDIFILKISSTFLWIIFSLSCILFCLSFSALLSSFVFS